MARFGIALICFSALGLIAAKTLRIETDFSAFLPPSATAEQRLLIAQLRDGLVSRLMLVALEGADEKELARASHTLAEKLGREPEFDYAANGSVNQFAVQGELLMRNRYALSSRVDAQKFSVPALRAALEEQLAQLASPFGLVPRALLARDPTGEFLAIMRGFDLGTMPQLRQGVWFSDDGKRAFLIAQTRAAGFDSVRQAAAIAKLRSTATAINPQVTVTLTGPGAFAAESHRLIESDAWKLSICSAVVVLGMLIFVYRSPLPVVLVMTPVAFGLLIGVLLVQAVFGSVHAITLGFAATLLGEAVDYPNYLLLNSARGESARNAAQRIGPTLALAVLTTVASAMALTLSSFRGLAQLGVLTMAGVAVAGLTTHRLIPWLLGSRVLDFRRLLVPAGASGRRAKWPGALALAATLAGAVGLAYTHPSWWEQDLTGISPVPAQMRELDASLRREMGAPEVSFFLASRGASETAALQAAEDIRPVLKKWQQENWIRSYDSPSLYLPSAATQATRLSALPDTPTLEKNLSEAMRGLAFRGGAFAPFVHDVAAARTQTPVTRETYAGTPLGAKLNALVIELEGQWLVLTPLGGVNDPGKLDAALAAMPDANTQLVDLKQVSAKMLDGTRREALRQAAWGVLLILLLLMVGLRSLRRTWRVAAPAVAALMLAVAVLAACGQKLNVFHLVALLLVLGIGLNYALFFERPAADAEDRERTRLALAVCSISTIATFGFLALSATPVLRAIGSTVALGALLSLVLAALWARPADAGAAI
jgi:predicted exporter